MHSYGGAEWHSRAADAAAGESPGGTGSVVAWARVHTPAAAPQRIYSCTRDVDATGSCAGCTGRQMNLSLENCRYLKNDTERYRVVGSRTAGSQELLPHTCVSGQCYLPAKRAGPRRAITCVFNQIVTIPEAAATQEGWCPGDALCLEGTQEGLPGAPQHSPAAESAKVPSVCSHRSLFVVTVLSAGEPGKDGGSPKSQYSQSSALFVACKVISTQDLCHAYGAAVYEETA